MTREWVVLHRDRDWLAVEKPSGIPTTAPDTARVDSLVDLVRRDLASDVPHVHPLSRLDVEVTGVVLFALSKRALSLANDAKSTGSYAREYRALLAGVPEPPEGEWTWPIGVDRADKRRRVASGGTDEVAAHTVFRVVAVASRARVAHVSLSLRTGRTHQIRVHSARSGCPVVGDKTYGGPRHLTLEDGTVVTARRVMLHAHGVAIPGTTARIVSPLPADFVACWRALGGSEG